MTRCLLTLLVLLTAAPLTLFAAPHTFTNLEGRTLEAELIKADPTHASLRLKGGKTVSVLLTTLIDEDRLYISKWLTDKLPDLEIRPDFDRARSKTTGSPMIKQAFKMEVEMKNFSPNKDLEESQVIYYLIGRSISNDDQYKVMSRQVLDVTIPHGQTKTLTFEEISNRYRDLEGRNRSNFNRSYQGLGYVLHIKRKRDMRQIHLESSTTILDKAKANIVKLAEEDVVDETFIKAEKKPAEEEPKEEKKPDEVITIR